MKMNGPGPKLRVVVGIISMCVRNAGRLLIGNRIFVQLVKGELIGMANIDEIKLYGEYRESIK